MVAINIGFVDSELVSLNIPFNKPNRIAHWTVCMEKLSTNVAKVRTVMYLNLVLALMRPRQNMRIIMSKRSTAKEWRVGRKLLALGNVGKGHLAHRHFGL